VNPPDTVVVGDTVLITVEALNRSGDVIPDAQNLLISLDPDTIAVTASGLSVVGLLPGGGRIVAGTGNLRSAPFRIGVRAP
jgi:hypothetical protein